MPVIVECEWCGKKVKKMPGQVREHNFCSRDCSGASRSTKVEIECDWCGKPFKRKKGHVSEHNFCSVECYDEWQRSPEQRERSSKRYKANPVPVLRGEDHPNWGGGEVEVECDWCGVKFIKPNYEARTKERHFCCREHYHEWRRSPEQRQKFRELAEERGFSGKSGKDSPRWVPKVEVTCKQCGKVRKAFPSQADRPFCDRECMAAWMSEHGIGKGNRNWHGGKKVPCANCGKLVYRTPGYLEQCENHFCSPKCQGTWRSEHLIGSDNPNWRGGHIPYYGPDWCAQRRKARKRDKYICQGCDITERELGRQLDVHHIIPFRKFGLERYKEANVLSNLIALCPSCHKIAEGDTA